MNTGANARVAAVRGLNLARFVLVFAMLATGIAGRVLAQGTIHRSTPESETTDSNGHLKTDQSTRPNDTTIHGLVVLAGDSALEEPVEISRDCDGLRTVIAITNSKGRFSFNSDVLGDLKSASGCVLKASLDGYRGGTKTMAEALGKASKQPVRIVLQPSSTSTEGLTSATDVQASKAQRKLYEKAREEAAGQEWPKAIASLKNAVAAYPGYGSAWLALGVVQHFVGNMKEVEESFLEAARVDPAFALAWLRAATFDAARGDWQATILHCQKAIALNATAFPRAYALSAIANVNLQKLDDAYKTALEGLRLDADHQFPELEYALGTALYGKNDFGGAKTHLQAYLDLAKNGQDASAARSLLSQMARAAGSEEPKPTGSPALPKGASDLLQTRNAPLLMKTPVHTCLESISQLEFDNRGRPHDATVTRVEIAVSNGEEIYDRADGKRFANESLADILNYSFSSTGLFSSIARAVIAGNEVQVDSGSDEIMNGESVIRYTFQSAPGARGWSIQYGAESGRAGEDGWFFVEKTGMILRRLVVRAVNIPRNLKLNKLEAVIDYEAETIADRRVLLPSVAQVHVDERTGSERVSRLFFDHCRAFTAESSLSFGTDSAETRKGVGSGGAQLPPDMEVTVSLLSPVSPAGSAANDLLRAAVVNTVSKNGREIIASGALIEGHVRPRRGEAGVVIELDRVQTRAGWAPFYARLVSVAATPEGWTNGAKPPSKANLKDESSADLATVDLEVPGVAKLTFANQSAELPAGTQMTWKTESITAATESHAPQLSTPVSMH